MSAAAEGFVSAVIAEGLKSYFKHGKVHHLFISEGDQALFGFVDKHAREFGKLPDPSTVDKHTGIELAPAKEPSGYYLELLRRSYTENGIRQAAKKAESYLQPDNKDPFKALDAITASLSEVQFNGLQQVVGDFREAGPSLKAAYKANLLKAEDSDLKFGWPTLDAMTGGIVEGDVVSLVANTGLGKTLCGLRMAEKAWEQGRVPLFVSMEIKPLPIYQRIAAIYSGKGLSAIKQSTLSSATRDAYFAQLDALPDLPRPFYVVDGNLQSTAHDIQALVGQLKPGLLVIDGAYLMKHPTEKDRYRRIAENMDLIKTNLADTCPVVCSWQFNREGRKLKKDQKPDLEHIAGSDAIGTHSSLVLAMFQDENVETGAGRKIEVLKGRNGETGSFSIRWNLDFQTDMSELSEDPFAALED